MQTRLHRCRKQTGSVEAMFCCSIGEIQLSLFRVRQGGPRIFYIANDAESIRCNISWTFAIEQPHDEGLGSEMAFQGVSMAILFGASALRAGRPKFRRPERARTLAMDFSNSFKFYSASCFYQSLRVSKRQDRIFRQHFRSYMPVVSCLL